MTIGHYSLVRQLPGGRHGAIWKARDEYRSHDVALKQLANLPPEVQDRVRDEADRLVGLRDEHLVRSQPAVPADDDIWLVEDWVAGISLDAVLAGSAGLTRSQGLGVLRGALLGLTAAHRSGIVHGELSPRSVMISSAGAPIVVGLGAHVAGADVAGLGDFASPETKASQQVTAAADVFSAGVILGRLLGTEGVPDDLRPVLERATAADPAARQADAGALLAELEPAADRAYGAAWWSTAGLSGVVTSTLASTAAGAGAAGAGATGGAGAVTGGLSAGEGALAGSMSLGRAGGAGSLAGGSGAGALAGAARKGGGPSKRAGLIIGASVAVLVVVVVAAVAVFRLPQTTTATPQSNAQAGGGAASQGATPTTSVPPASQPTQPAPKPRPNPRLGFSGTYRWETVVTKSTSASSPVGKKFTGTWTVRTTCAGTKCTSSIQQVKGAPPIKLDVSAGQWRTVTNSKGRCVNLRTGLPSGDQVPLRYIRTLTPGPAGTSGITSITGSERNWQLKNCKNQSGPRYDVTSKITMKKIG